MKIKLCEALASRGRRLHAVGIDRDVVKALTTKPDGGETVRFGFCMKPVGMG